MERKTREVTIELANKRDRKETLKREVRQRYKSVH